MKCAGCQLVLTTRSSTSDCHGSNVYTGKENGTVQKDLSKKSVVNLMKPFLNKGHTIVMDNYNSFIDLFKQLKSQGTLACGTVRSNRRGLYQRRLRIQKQMVKALKRGGVLYLQHGTMTCVTWQDKKTILMLTTAPVDSTANVIVEWSQKQNNK